mgnify:CR=1 FL=1
METKQEHYESMMQAITRYAPSTDLEVIQRAYEYADEKHKNQLRKSGEPYIIHPLAVAEIVAEIGLDTDAITAALLHDCLEDTDASFEEISRMFGETVANLVEGVTKLTRVQYSTMEEQQMENLRKMFMAMSKDIRVILIKIADRLHNTRTLQYQTPAKQISKSMETMEVYAPLAHRLGMQKIKWELEDTSLQYLDPEGYQEIIDYLKKNEDSANSFMNAIQSKITDRLASVGIHGSIYGRIKHTYSIYRKMRAQNKTIDELYDLYAFRVIVDNIADCYNVLGHIHDLFNPIPGRFKDYISTPKPNMYQSLHTTVIGSQGIPFEVQIRTWEMHQTAEYGVAAHWKYKQHAGEGSEKEFEWVRRLLENQQDVEADDYIHSLKVDMFDDEVFVFTPKGKVISLPAGSTPIDFAYAIHSAVGNSMIGAKVNNRIASYDAPLHNGDIVEILTSKTQKPKADWLNIVTTSKARNKIRAYMREEQAKAASLGREELERKIKNWKLSITMDDAVMVLSKYYKLRTGTELYGQIAQQKIILPDIKEILTRHLNGTLDDGHPLKAPSAAKIVSDNDDALIIDNSLSNIEYKLAKCCNPIFGDEIFGFTTINSGITIHRQDCPNAQRLKERYPYRVLPARWQQNAAKGAFVATVRIQAEDATGLVNKIAEVINRDLKINIRSMSLNSSGGMLSGLINIEVTGTQLVDAVVYSLMRIKGVQKVFRVNK